MRVPVEAGASLALMYMLAAYLPACSSTSMEVEPSIEHPRVACIASSPFAAQQRRSKEGNRILPEIVRVIGVTSPEDGERWKVLRSGVFNADEWVPYAKEEIQFHGCGPEAEAHRELMRAEAAQ